MSAHLLSDTPLLDTDHDGLGRNKFCEMVAKSIVGLKTDSGFVYAIYG